MPASHGRPHGLAFRAARSLRDTGQDSLARFRLHVLVGKAYDGAELSFQIC